MSEALDRLTAALADRYRIERELGAGGMATVYLAHDVKHDRQVAVKVLRPELAAVLGAERFLREIKTIANLQHPHILGLIDSGEVNGTAYYVMPFVEGESLRDRLNREKQLPIPDAVRLASEVAAALDYAHRHGVIHRDIKPENIMLHDGSALVADFGIALAVSSAGGSRMTETGMSLGTPHYMSPEQAMGEREITARSDVYALGAMTYEMLAGDPPFTGSTAQVIVAKVMTDEPVPLRRHRKAVPEHVEDAVLTALEKLPADRFATAAEFSSALGHTRTLPTHRTTGRRAAAATIRWQGLVPWAIALAAIGAAGWGWLRPAPVPPVIRYALAFPPSQAMVPRSQTPVAAPDGSFLIYLGPGEAGPQLWLKRRDSDTPTPLAGTTGAQSFAVSPDGGWVAFIVNGRLNKIPVTGGTPVLLASDNVSGSYGLAWTGDGTIVHAARGAAGLMSVSATGDSSTPLWRLDSMLALSPSALPGGHGVLFVARPLGLATSQLMAINGPADSGHLLVPDAIGGGFVAPDLLVYSTEAGGMFAVPFDLERLKVTGKPTPLGERLATNLGFPAFSISAAGTLIKLPGGANTGRTFEMVWVDRAGRETAVDSSWKFQLTAIANNHGWALSPDGSRLAIGLNTGAGDDIWVKPLPTGAPYRVSFDPGSDNRPRWTGDSRFITFIGRRRSEGVYRRRADASGSDSLLLPGIYDEALVSPDQRWLVLRLGSVGAMAGGRNIAGVRLGLDTVPVPVLATEFDEMAVALSPDGKWLAYQSNETGRTEIFVRPFPDTDAGKKQVSSGGGVAPLWSRDGKELFYLSSNKEMMASRVTPGAMIELSTPVVLFRVRDELLGAEANWYTPWDVARDGRFIMARLVSSASDEASAVVVENWIQELRATVKR
jgi:serine/threonine-protein kinase